ncbi:MAG: cupin domain-containing protein, partial [Ktedonobacteraceae bacterium]|nr:cupin domain-containing protein [Ktedonobacteraceae bacterium]
KTLEMPVNNAGDTDQANIPFQTMPGPDGTVFGFALFPPENEIGAGALAQDMKTAGGAQSEAHFTNRERHPGMHRTTTLDYNIILEGEIWLLTDTDEVLLKAGDTVVCRGANHHWQNRANVPCVSLFVLLDALPLEAS